MIDSFQTAVFFSTVRITISRQNGAGCSIGTGFLVNAPLPWDPKSSTIFLVSNKHVYGNGDEILLHFNRGSIGLNGTPQFEKAVVVAAKREGLLYTEHPDPDIDLACLSVSKLLNQHSPLYVRPLNISLIPDVTEPIPFNAGDRLWFVGYPDGRYDIAHNLPILREGCFASIPSIDFNDSRCFLIDAQVFGGSSGSPVFAPQGSDVCFVGVVTATIIRMAKPEPGPVSPGLHVNQILGLGIVLKAGLVQELVIAALSNLRNLMSIENDQ